MTTFNSAPCSQRGRRFPDAHIRVALFAAPLIAAATIVLGAPTIDDSAQLSAAAPVNKTTRRATPPRDPVARAKWYEQLALEGRIAQGKELFHRQWESREADGKLGLGDGLGPLFNERSCAACHRQGSTGGGGPSENNVQLLVVRRLPAGDKWESTTTAQRDFLLPTATSDTFLLHRFGTSRDYEKWRLERLSLVKGGAPAEAVSEAARVKHLYEAGLELELVDDIHGEGDGSLGKKVPEKPSLIGLTLEERNTTALFGAGLIDKVHEQTLRVIMMEQPVEVRGRVPYTAERVLGRFGWKAQNATLLAFNAGACAAELGLDTKILRQAKAPIVGQEAKPYANLFNISKGIDVKDEEIQALTDYVASLPAPHRPDTVRKTIDIRYGELHFTEIGCASCHRRDVGEISEIYSDLLLHDVGLQSSAATYYASVIDLVGGGDPKRSADPNEFRTPPLWGVADSAPYLHDGRAATLEQAIEQHGGQAVSTVRRYKQLNDRQRNQLLMFLGSLRAPREIP